MPVQRSRDAEARVARGRRAGRSAVRAAARPRHRRHRHGDGRAGIAAGFRMTARVKSERRSARLAARSGALHKRCGCFGGAQYLAGRVHDPAPRLRSGREERRLPDGGQSFSRAGAERGFPSAVVFPAVAVVLAGRREGGVPGSRLGAERIRDRGALAKRHHAAAKRDRAEGLHPVGAPAGVHPVQRVPARRVPSASIAASASRRRT